MARSRMIPRAALAGIPAVLSACATGGGPATERCPSDVAFAYLPLTELQSDSAGLARELTALWDAATGRTVASVWFDAEGAADSAEVISAGMTPATQSSVVGLLLRNTVPNAQRGGVANFILGDEAGPAPQRVSGFRMCRPSLTNERDVGRLLEAQVMELDEFGLLPRPMVSVLRMQVGTLGQVVSLEVFESAGSSFVDRAAARVMSAATFAPATVEGIPTSVWIQIPVRMEMLDLPPLPDRN